MSVGGYHEGREGLARLAIPGIAVEDRKGSCR
jgi:hypothetical protein